MVDGRDWKTSLGQHGGVEDRGDEINGMVMDNGGDIWI
jgi:hypothetical protein